MALVCRLHWRPTMMKTTLDTLTPATSAGQESLAAIAPLALDDIRGGCGACGGNCEPGQVLLPNQDPFNPPSKQPAPPPPPGQDPRSPVFKPFLQFPGGIPDGNQR